MRSVTRSSIHVVHDATHRSSRSTPACRATVRTVSAVVPPIVNARTSGVRARPISRDISAVAMPHNGSESTSVPSMSHRIAFMVAAVTLRRRCPGGGRAPPAWCRSGVAYRGRSVPSSSISDAHGGAVLEEEEVADVTAVLAALSDETGADGEVVLTHAETLLDEE